MDLKEDMKIKNIDIPWKILNYNNKMYFQKFF